MKMSLWAYSAVFNASKGGLIWIYIVCLGIGVKIFGKKIYSRYLVFAYLEKLPKIISRSENLVRF